MEEFNRLFGKARFNYNGRRFERANEYFKLAMKYANEDEKFKVMYYLFKIEINRSEYKKARVLLEKYYELNPFLGSLCQGVLDKREYNFKSSEICFTKCLEMDEIHDRSLLEIARLKVQTGNLDEAEYIYKELVDYNKIKVVLELGNMYLLQKEYDKALALIDSIEDEYPEFIKATYQTLRMKLLYLIGKIGKEEMDESHIYAIRRVVDSNNKLLQYHLSKHVNPKSKSYLYQYMGLKNLEKKVENIIMETNGIHGMNSDRYLFRLKESVGVVNGVETRDIEVITDLNSKTILTMFPARLSDNFDMEHNQSLKRKKK